MSQLFEQINHPLSVGQKVEGQRKSCPCKNAQIQSFTGTIGKVIHNQSGYWYYLSDRGVTIRAQEITAVLT